MTVKSQSLGLRTALLAGVLVLVPAAAAMAQPPTPPTTYTSTEYSPPTSQAGDRQEELFGDLGPLQRRRRRWSRRGWRAWLSAAGRQSAAPPSPPPGRAPLKPGNPGARWTPRRRLSREADARHEPIAGDAVACLPEGFPAMMNAIFPIEFLQTPGQVTVIEEAFNEVRRIYLDEKQGEIGDVEPVWNGHSVGHWEGKTLVVDTIGVKDQAKFRSIPHSDQMRVTERMKLLSPDFLQDEVTIVDPVVQTAPWTFTWVYKRNPGYKIQEYVCEAPREYKDENGATRLRITK